MNPDNLEYVGGEAVVTMEDALGILLISRVPLAIAVVLSREDILEMAYTFVDVDNPDATERMAFSKLCKTGTQENLPELQALITARGGLDFFQNHPWARTDGNDGLMVACRANNALTAQLLIDYGHRTDRRNDLGETAIDIAARHDCLPIALLLINNGSDLPASALAAYGLALEAPVPAPVQNQGLGQGLGLGQGQAAAAAPPLVPLSEETKQQRRAELSAARLTFVRNLNWSRRSSFCMYLATSGHRPLLHRLHAPGYVAPPQSARLDVFAGDPVVHVASFL